jgi:hypothetical protein
LALAQLADPGYTDLPEDGEQMTPLRLTAGEHRRLKVRAAECGSTITALIRRAMAATGLIAGS